MSRHLFGLVVTSYGVAANNRGENEGNITTLQKLLWNGDVHTTVSAEAIRWALRYYWQRAGLPVNRVWDEGKSDHTWQDENWTGWESQDGQTYIDDDVLGFMRADAAQVEGNEAEGRGRRARGRAIKRRGALEVTRAISLTPFAGDITFNATSGEKTNTSLYGTEVHATRYQFGFALTPESLRQPGRVLPVVDAVVGLSEVAGNHSRFLYDFSPDAIIFRWTEDFAPRILYGFALEDSGSLTIPVLLSRVEAGDINAEELVVGGAIANTPDGNRLRELGAEVVPGVNRAANLVKERIRRDLDLGAVAWTA